MEEVLFYTVYQQDAITMSQTCRGLFLTRSAADSALVQRAEQFVINKIGLDNFIPHQLENPELLKKIVNGYVLKRGENDRVEVCKRMQSYWSYSEVSVCSFGILPVLKDLKHTSETEPVNTIDHMALYSSIRQPIVRSRTTTMPKPVSLKFKYEVPSGIQQSLMDKFQEELKQAVNRQMTKIQAKETRTEESSDETESQKLD